MEGPPAGAIGVADPRDVLRAAQSSHRQSIAIMSPSKRNSVIVPEGSKKLEPEAGRDVGANAGEDQQHTSSTEQRKHPPSQPTVEAGASFSPRSRSARLPRVLEDDSTYEDRTERRKNTKEKKEKKKKSKYGESKISASEVHKQSRGRMESTNKSNIDAFRYPRDVPMAFKDWRLPVEKIVDDMIDSIPSFKNLTTFEPGSLLDYIDMIGITRREAFRNFPDNSPLPTVPNTLRIKALDAFQEALDTARVNMPPPTGPFVLSEGEQTLAKALEIESRRADLLEHQVKMLRSELVTALKRWEVFIVALLPEVPEPADATEEMKQAYQQRLQPLNTLRALTGTKKVMVLESHEKVMDEFPNRIKNVHSHSLCGEAEIDRDEATAEDSCASSSETESSLWSSSSEEGDD